MANMKNITIENAVLLFRNFSGKPGPFNHEGERSFAVKLDEAQAQQMADAGFPVKGLKPRDEEDAPGYFVKVKVSYAQKPPAIYMIAGGKKTLLDEASIATLDYAEIQTVDLVVTPYQWEIAGRSGIAAYVKSMYVTIDEDDLASKYANL